MVRLTMSINQAERASILNAISPMNEPPNIKNSNPFELIPLMANRLVMKETKMTINAEMKGFNLSDTMIIPINPAKKMPM